jgi:CBS domain-containing protein
MTRTDRDGEQVSQQESAGAVQGAGAHDKAADDAGASSTAAGDPGTGDAAAGDESARAARAEGDDPRVADIMERHVVTVAPDATVHELVLLLRAKDLGGVPVVDGAHRLVGIVTEGDLVIEDADVRLPHYFELFGNLVYLGGQKKFEERLKKMVGNAVADVMTTEVFTVGPDDPAPRAANIMVDKKVNRVPVVDGDGRLVGIVARHDIIRMLGL